MIWGFSLMARTGVHIIETAVRWFDSTNPH